MSIYFFGRAQAVLDRYFWDVVKNHGWVPSNNPESYKADRQKFLDAIQPSMLLRTRERIWHLPESLTDFIWGLTS